MNDRGQSLGGGATLLGSRIAVLSLVLLTAACAPVMREFYRPAAPEGKVARTACPPVHRLILFKRHDVTIGITADVLSKDHVEGVVTFEVPEGNVVHLLDQEVEVSVPSRRSARQALDRQDNKAFVVVDASVCYAYHLWPDQSRFLYVPLLGITGRTRSA